MARLTDVRMVPVGVWTLSQECWMRCEVLVTHRGPGRAFVLESTQPSGGGKRERGAQIVCGQLCAAVCVPSGLGNRVGASRRSNYLGVTGFVEIRGLKF